MAEKVEKPFPAPQSFEMLMTPPPTPSLHCSLLMWQSSIPLSPPSSAAHPLVRRGQIPNPRAAPTSHLRGCGNSHDLSHDSLLLSCGSLLSLADNLLAEQGILDVSLTSEPGRHLHGGSTNTHAL